MSLSPGEWWRVVPTDPTLNIAFRKALLERARDRDFRKGLLAICRQDLLFFIAAFVWQFNPKQKGDQVGPFLPWDFQREALLDRPETTGKKGILWCYEHDKTAVVEKSREMGASWLFLILQVWLGVFHKHTKALNISRSADAVDCKDPDSLFWKIRFIHEYLPDWLLGPVLQESMHIEYRRTRSYVTGEASTGKAGVGGRAGVIFVDEFPRIREDKEVRRGTASTADCRFFNGTHQGLDTEFYEMTQSPDIVKLQFHWTQHPEKRKGLYRYDSLTGKVDVLDKSYAYPADFVFVMDGSPTGGPFPGVRSPWYDWKCGDIGSARGVAMELDINPTGSVSQFFDAIVLRNLIAEFCCEPFWRGDLKIDTETGKPLGVIPSPGGPLRLWCRLNASGQPPRGRYAVAVDTATGIGASPSCVSIVNQETGEKVGEYTNAHIEPTPFGEVVVGLCYLFESFEGTSARLIWETNGPGDTMGKRVIELGFRNFFYRQKETDSLYVEPTKTAGWVPTPRSKTELLRQYNEALANRRFLNRSEEALRECTMFRYGKAGYVEHSLETSTSNPEDARVNHADHVIADALAWKLTQTVWQRQFEEKKAETPVLSLQWRRDYHERQDQEREEAFGY